MTVPKTSRRSSDRKAVLFCAECGHESPLGGDWSLNERDDGRTDVDCPDCGRTLVSQPRFQLLA